MNHEILYYVDEWAIFLGAVLILVLCMEIGFQFGKRNSSTDEKDKELASTMSGAMIGFMALLLGFSFSMAVDRFDTRKNMLDVEVNDIGTAYTRIDLLPAKEQKLLRPLFRQYVDARIKYYNESREVMMLGIAEGNAVRNKMWAITKDVVLKNPNPITMGYLGVFENMGDDATRRSTARDNHVPEVILWILFGMAAMTIGVNGYSAGMGKKRGLGLRLLLVLCFTLVLILIVDLDRPRRGMIVNNQQAMFDLRDSINIR